MKHKLDKTALFLSAIVFVVFLVVCILSYSSKRAKLLERLVNPKALIPIEIDEKYGYMNSNGKIVISPKYSKASSWVGDFALVAVRKDYSEKIRIIDKNEKVYFSVDYLSDVLAVPEYKIWVIEGKLYDSKLKLISDESDEVTYLRDGFLEYRNEKNKLTGLMNYKGKKTYSYKFTDKNESVDFSVSATSSKNRYKYCIATNNKKTALINCNTGKIIYNYSKDIISSLDNNVFLINREKSNKNNQIVVVDNDKEIYKTYNTNNEIIYYNNIVVSENKDNYKKTYYNLKNKKTSESLFAGESLSRFESEEFDQYRVFSIGADDGVLKNDKVILPAKYSQIYPLDTKIYEYLKRVKNKEYVFAKKDDKYYLINLKNKKVIKEFNTDRITTYEESFFVTYKDNLTDETIIYNLLSNKTFKVNEDVDFDIDLNYFLIEGKKDYIYYNVNMKEIYRQER